MNNPDEIPEVIAQRKESQQLEPETEAEFEVDKRGKIRGSISMERLRSNQGFTLLIVIAVIAGFCVLAAILER